MESIKNEKEKIISSNLKKKIGRVHSLMDKMTIKKINFPHKSQVLIFLQKKLISKK